MKNEKRRDDNFLDFRLWFLLFHFYFLIWLLSSSHSIRIGQFCHWKGFLPAWYAQKTFFRKRRQSAWPLDNRFSS